MNRIVPRIIPGSDITPVEDAVTGGPVAAPLTRGAFDALAKRHRAAMPRDSNAAPLLQSLIGDANQRSETPKFSSPPRDTAAFAHRPPAPREQSATLSAPAPQPPNDRDQPQIANRRLRQVGGHLDGSGSPWHEARAQAPAPVERPKLTSDEVHFAKVAEYVLNHARDFCTNDAVLKSGTWQTQFSVDPEIMPDCVLHLSLSGSGLVLRFDTRDDTSSRLISKHAGTLKKRLATLMTERGISPGIEIVS